MNKLAFIRIRYLLIVSGILFCFSCGIPSGTTILVPINSTLVIKPAFRDDVFQFSYTSTVGTGYFKGIEIFYKIYPEEHISIGSDESILENNTDIYRALDVRNLGYFRLKDYDALSTLQPPLIKIPGDRKSEQIDFTMSLNTLTTGYLEIKEELEQINIICYRDSDNLGSVDTSSLEGFLFEEIDVDDHDIDPALKADFGDYINVNLVVEFYAMSYGFDMEKLVDVYSRPVNLGRLIIDNTNMPGTDSANTEVEGE